MNEMMARQHTRRTAIAAAVTVFVMGTAVQAQAQDTQQAASGDGEPQTVVVTGVRAALEQSLRQKRSADAVTEVVTLFNIRPFGVRSDIWTRALLQCRLWLHGNDRQLDECQEIASTYFRRYGAALEAVSKCQT